MRTTPRKKWIIDAILLANFLVAFMLDLTGVALHQWLGVSAAALIGYHLLIHWDWVKAVSQRFLGQTSDRSRLYYLLDVSLLAGFGAISLSGLFISTWLNLPLENFALWRGLHVAVSISTLILLLAKIALHWRWIVDVARRAVFAGGVPALPAQGKLQPAPVVTSRRDFLKLMGIVAGASAVALIGVVNDDAAETVSAAAVSDSLDNASVGSTTALASAKTTTTTTACVVRCNKRCAYPGRCRRYRDANGNRLCDLGECL
jgi:hypothetical protein